MSSPPATTHSRRQASRLAVGALILAWLVGVGLLYLPAWQTVERKVFDLLSVIEPPTPSLPIVIVAIDDASFTQLDLRWPWPRSTHAELLRRLVEAGAAVIAFDVQFSEHTTPEEDEAFAAAIAEAGNVVLASNVVRHETSGTIEELRMDPAIEFTQAGAHSGLAGMAVDGDGVVRRVAMHRDAFWRVVIDTMVTLYPDSVDEPYVPRGALLRYLGPPGTITAVPYHSVLQADPSVPSELFAGALVLIGLDSRTSTDATAGADRYATPFTMLDGRMMPGVEIHATQIENALMGHSVLPLARGWNIAAVSLVLLPVLPLLLFWHPLRSPLLALPVVAALCAAAYWLFHARYQWMATAAPLAALVVAYAGTGGGSYLVERRRAGEIRTTFARYVSSQIVDEMIEHPERLTLGGARREITVMFADLEGFTHFSEKLPPEAVGQLLNLYLNAMTRVILDNGGMIDKFIGDAVMAIWGAPLDDPRHARRALDAALAMQRAIGELQPRLHEFGLDQLRLRIGLSSGPATVGNMGSDLLFDYTAIGDTVNLASRLEGANKAYATPILLPAETAALLGEGIALRRVDRVRVKGRETPIDVFTPCEDSGLVQHSEALWRAYLARDWPTAANLLQCRRAVAPDDAIDALFANRIAAFEQQPPPAEWDGSTALEKM